VSSTDAQRDCLICSTEDAPEEYRVFQDELWSAEVVAGYDVPGWFILRTRRHAELLTSLTDDELTSFGPRARDLVAAVQAATEAPAVYLMAFGENYRHFHVLVAARGAEVPENLRSGAILALTRDSRDLEAALRLVPTVRARMTGLPLGDSASMAGPSESGART
jgi:diadenosine tetraphosphate (Ap4A) HIT family hydrolase